MSGLTEALALITLAGGAVAAAGVIWAKVIRPVASFVPRMVQAVHLVLYELQPNAGTSIKDRVARIDQRVRVLEEWRQRDQ